MKFNAYMQLAIAIIMNVCVWILAIKNMTMGYLNLAGGIIAALFIVITFLFIPLAWSEIKELDGNEKTLRR